MDAACFEWLNSQGGPGVDTFFWAVSELGKGEYATLLTVLLLMISWKGWPGWTVAWVVLAAVLSGLLTEQLKTAVDRPRPLAALAAGSARVVGEELRQRSFPSGHTASAFALCVTAVALGRRSKMSYAVGGILAATVGLSRIMVGAHFPGDVLAGALLGTWSAQAVLGVRRAVMLWAPWYKNVNV